MSIGIVVLVGGERKIKGPTEQTENAFGKYIRNKEAKNRESKLLGECVLWTRECSDALCELSCLASRVWARGLLAVPIDMRT